MSEDESMALVPVDEDDTGPPAALEAIYRDLPGDVVFKVEAERYAILRDLVEHLRTIRDALAPYGKFKEWCEAVGLRYGTVQQRLSRADRKSNLADIQSITDSQPEPDEPEPEEPDPAITAEDAVDAIDALILEQADRIRALEASLKAYQARPAAEWAAEAEQEAEHQALIALYTERFASGRPFRATDEWDRWLEGKSPEERKEHEEIVRRIEGLGGSIGHCTLGVAMEVLWLRKRDQETGHGFAPALLHLLAENWLKERELPVNDETRAAAVVHWEWVCDRAVEYGLDGQAALDAFNRRWGGPENRVLRLTEEHEIIDALTKERSMQLTSHEAESWHAIAVAAGVWEDEDEEAEEPAIYPPLTAQEVENAAKYDAQRAAATAPEGEAQQ